MSDAEPKLPPGAVTVGWKMIIKDKPVLAADMIVGELGIPAAQCLINALETAIKRAEEDGQTSADPPRGLE